VNKRFWEKPLAEVDAGEWEQLCDGCGQCCLIKLQDEDTEEIVATDVVCQFYDFQAGCCGVYPQRAVKKPDCFVIDRENTEHFSWLPKTCAYRLRYEDKSLFDWHPLISGSRQAMIDEGIAVSSWGISERAIDEEELSQRVIFSLSEPE
jgi:uncharacterized cysteine cluster protein YcgN (CxxCxxCC family)